MPKSLSAKPKTFLVTGGAGFLGSHLCARLVADGHHVLCMDNFYTGTHGNLAALLARPQFRLLEHDVCAPLDGSLAVDGIYHLACPASPVHYQRRPVETTRTCVLGTLNMLELARRLCIPILQASTSEVYGDPDVHPQPESYLGCVNPIGPRACYDEGKRCAETLCFDYHREHGVAIKVARIFNTYGPHMHPDDGRVVSNFIVQALGGWPLTIYGDGQQTRSFCYVDDLVDGLVRLMNMPEDFTGPVNLGNPGEFTIRQLADLVIAMTGARSAIELHPLPQDDPRQRCPDITLARQRLQWVPSTVLQDGLARTIPWFDARLAAEG